MKKKKIIIGSRGSKLALIYAQKVKNKILEKSEFKKDQITIRGIITKGDKVIDKRLSDFGGKGLFSKNIEKELLDNKIDIPTGHTENHFRDTDFYQCLKSYYPAFYMARIN